MNTVLYRRKVTVNDVLHQAQSQLYKENFERGPHAHIWSRRAEHLFVVDLAISHAVYQLLPQKIWVDTTRKVARLVCERVGLDCSGGPNEALRKWSLAEGRRLDDALDALRPFDEESAQ